MMQDASDLRGERKYPLSAAELSELRWWQRGPGRRFARAFPARTVHNIYFDSPDWDAYADNLSGMSRRTKCRLRWYGEPDAGEDVVFEAKHRQNALGHKRQHRIRARDLGLDSLPLERLYKRLRPHLDGALRLWLDQAHRPVLYNRYRREYYAAPDGVRMTVDTDLAFAPLRGGPLWRLRLIPSAAPAVVEFKYPLERRRELEEALRRLPFRATRSSKYVVGINHLLPH